MITEQFDRAHGIELGSGNNAHNSEKLEVMVDPVQSMLLDMIPSLGTKKVDSIDRVVEEPRPPEHNTAETLEKKKVSYKDLATELLRDW
ncbi:putative DNA ligase 4 [Camellia sinensis]|nr:putative DNA ligase 4 [Camellia sinensis]